MGLFPSFNKKKEFFTPEENEQIVSAIRNCEGRTSGEVRVYIESHNPYVDPLERAGEIFIGLKMNLTHHRNAVLLYIAHRDHEVALFGDQGIHEAVGKAYWSQEVKEMLQYFRENHLAEGVVHCLRHIGDTLAEKFPYIPTEDKNELPDEIVFGK